jgi:hypothetical protein
MGYSAGSFSVTVLPTPRMAAHDASLSGGATWHWPLDGDNVEAVVGGSPVDLTGGGVFHNSGPAVDAVSFFDAKRSTATHDTDVIGAAVRIQTAITVAAWFCRTADNTTNTVICGARISGAGEANNIQWELGITSGNFIRFIWQFGAADEIEEGLSGAISTLDVWEHWTFTRDAAGTSAKLYKNGVLDGAFTGLTKATGGGNVSKIIVGDNTVGVEAQGNIFSPIVFEEEFDAATVLALYQSSLPAQTQGTAVAHVPITGGETNLIAGYPGDGSATDVGPTPFVLDLDTPVFAGAGSHYNGIADVFDISTTQLLATTEGVASGAAFQIPTANGVTIGGMFFITAAEATPYFIANGTTFTNLSYALMQQSGTIKYQTAGGIWDTGVTTPADCWFHLCASSQPDRTSTKVYLNGVNIGGTLVTVATTPHADSELYIGNIDAPLGDFTGQCSDIIIADVAYTDAGARALAENAFGHVLP